MKNELFFWGGGGCTLHHMIMVKVLMLAEHPALKTSLTVGILDPAEGDREES